MSASSRPGPTGPPRRPGRPRGPSQTEHLRQRLIAEASALYAEGGYRGTSLALVAERAGLTKATVFHYFPNKDALVDAVFAAFGGRLAQAAAGWFDAPPAAHAARLERLVHALVDFYGTDPVNARILCQGMLAVPGPRGGSHAPPIFAEFVARFVAFIEAGIAAGEFYPDRPMATIMSIGGIILFELMLPERGRPATTRVALAARRREMAAVIARAVVRPATRMTHGRIGGEP